MNELQRLKKVINWLIYTDYAETATDIARMLGYNKSSLSQIVNGTTPLSSKFAERISSIDKNINKDWILTGKGSMFLDTSHKESLGLQNLIGDSSSNFMNNNISGAGNNVSYASGSSLPATPISRTSKSIEIEKTNNPFLIENERLKQTLLDRDNIIVQKNLLIELKDVLIAEKERTISILMKQLT